MSKFSVDLEALYRKTGNPLFVMAALADYEICPDDKPLPAWVMDYIREAAMALELIADVEQPSAALKMVNAALRLSGHGNNNAFAKYKLIIRAENAAFVDDHRKELFVRKGKPEKVGFSRAWIAKHTGAKSDRTVRDRIKLIRELRAAQKGK